jgi:gamma-glutamyltranspeptidase/glutathione hydrolase
VWRAPLRGWFRGHEVITAPPPSSGGLILLQALAILDGLPLEAERREALGRQAVAEDALADPAGLDARAVHWWIEALRRAFAERAEHLGDPDQHPVPLELLLSPAWVAQARLSIGERAEPEAVLPTPLPEGTETTHVSVLDPRGSAVSLTTTLNGAFGSAILVRGAGFLLNNELDDFALPEATPNQFALVGGEANRIAPFKRPLSSLTPTVLVGEGGAVALVLGGPGGPRIATSVLAVCLRLLAYGQSLEQAVAAPRLHQQWSPSATEFEPGWPPALLDELRRRGHEVREVEARFGGVQAIRVLPGGEVRGVSDPRRAGRAVPAERRREP